MANVDVLVWDRHLSYVSGSNQCGQSYQYGLFNWSLDFCVRVGDGCWRVAKAVPRKSTMPSTSCNIDIRILRVVRLSRSIKVPVSSVETDSMSEDLQGLRGLRIESSWRAILDTDVKGGSQTREVWLSTTIRQRNCGGKVVGESDSLIRVKWRGEGRHNCGDVVDRHCYHEAGTIVCFDFDGSRRTRSAQTQAQRKQAERVHDARSD